MKRLRFSPVLIVCFLLWLARTPGLAVITVQITPAANQKTTFNLSGQFDGAVNVNLYDLVAFAFAPPQLFTGNPGLFYPFASSLATVSNVTRHTSAEISYFVDSTYPEFDFKISSSLLTQPGEVLSLVSHGPVVAPTLPFTSFVPGTYAFVNTSMGTTFQIAVVPEPATLTVLGMGWLVWMVRRRRPAR